VASSLMDRTITNYHVRSNVEVTRDTGRDRGGRARLAGRRGRASRRRSPPPGLWVAGALRIAANATSPASMAAGQAKFARSFLRSNQDYGFRVAAVGRAPE